MFKIRPDQADALAEDDLIRRIEAWLRTRHPARVAAIAPEDLRAMIVHCFGVARSYGFYTERALFTFVIDMLAVGPCFHLQPKIQAILADTRAGEEDRLDRIVDDVDDASWDEAGEITDKVAYWDDVLAQARGRA
ncbi:hypothetical protein [Nannocystis pusilla]|uniref:Uncharacterized protein n=1 Tax=Nannocystis pusilla TaxID=889268 RepID=A0ABS7U1H4_9BACT|nr:hypothetical protein [Nannocystis pusilla]MBZ5714281.1 hypothetical protein [Nannocystis pusilla]